MDLDNTNINPSTIVRCIYACIFQHFCVFYSYRYVNPCRYVYTYWKLFLSRSLHFLFTVHCLTNTWCTDPFINLCVSHPCLLICPATENYLLSFVHFRVICPCIWDASYWAVFCRQTESRDTSLVSNLDRWKSTIVSHPVFIYKPSIQNACHVRVRSWAF